MIEVLDDLLFDKKSNGIFGLSCSTLIGTIHMYDCSIMLPYYLRFLAPSSAKFHFQTDLE